MDIFLGALMNQSSVLDIYSIFSHAVNFKVFLFQVENKEHFLKKVTLGQSVKPLPSWNQLISNVTSVYHFLNVFISVIAVYVGYGSSPVAGSSLHTGIILIIVYHFTHIHSKFGVSCLTYLKEDQSLKLEVKSHGLTPPPCSGYERQGWRW